MAKYCLPLNVCIPYMVIMLAHTSIGNMVGHSARWEDALKRCRENGSALLKPPFTRVEREDLSRLVPFTLIWVNARKAPNENDKEWIWIDGKPKDDGVASNNLAGKSCGFIREEQIHAGNCSKEKKYMCQDDMLNCTSNIGRCHVSNNSVSWFKAREACMMRGTYLVTNESQNINVALKTKLCDSSKGCWIGLGRLTWHSKEANNPVAYPDSQFAGNEDCGAYNITSGGYVSADCSDIKPFICRVPPDTGERNTDPPPERTENPTVEVSLTSDGRNTDPPYGKTGNVIVGIFIGVALLCAFVMVMVFVRYKWEFLCPCISKWLHDPYTCIFHNETVETSHESGAELSDSEKMEGSIKSLSVYDNCTFKLLTANHACVKSEERETFHPGCIETCSSILRKNADEEKSLSSAFKLGSRSLEALTSVVDDAWHYDPVAIYRGSTVSSRGSRKYYVVDELFALQSPVYTTVDMENKMNKSTPAKTKTGNLKYSLHTFGDSMYASLENIRTQARHDVSDVDSSGADKDQIQDDEEMTSQNSPGVPPKRFHSDKANKVEARGEPLKPKKQLLKTASLNRYRKKPTKSISGKGKTHFPIESHQPAPSQYFASGESDLD